MEEHVKNEREMIREVFEPGMTEEHRRMIFEVDPRDGEQNNDSMFDRWFYSCASYKESFDFKEFVSKYHDEGIVENFIYLRQTGKVYNTFIPCDHMHFMAGMWTLTRLSNRQVDSFSDEERRLQYILGRPGELADIFLYDALGAYQSSCSRDLWRHKNFEMNAAEHTSFRKLQHHICDW